MMPSFYSGNQIPNSSVSSISDGSGGGGGTPPVQEQGKTSPGVSASSARSTSSVAPMQLEVQRAAAADFSTVGEKRNSDAAQDLSSTSEGSSATGDTSEPQA